MGQLGQGAMPRQPLCRLLVTSFFVIGLSCCFDVIPLRYLRVLVVAFIAITSFIVYGVSPFLFVLLLI